MKRTVATSLLLLLVAPLLDGAALAQIYPGYMKPGEPLMRQSMARHRYVMRNGLPERYKNLTNPVSATEDNVRDGSKLYATGCAACHGEKGFGDGPAGAGLSPRPSSLADTVRMPIATDAYLFWTISEGGKELKTAMPAFKESLAEEERWKIVLYLRLMTGTKR